VSGDGPIRVAIVDDQPVVRVGLARILGPADGFEVVVECDDGDEVADAVRQHRPDIVLMDVRMRRLDGITATRRLSERSDVPVLVLTTFDDDDVLWGALDAGAAGFVLKDCTAADLIAAVTAVARGAAWFDPKVVPRVLGEFRNTVRRGRTEASTRLEQLTDREHDVLRLIARGATNSEIADVLFVSEATVKSHVGSIFAKLGARDRAAAIVLAYDHGLVEPGSEGGSENRTAG
jgi:DNA-binding NarL/FixJ family response regulator